MWSPTLSAATRRLVWSDRFAPNADVSTCYVGDVDRVKSRAVDQDTAMDIIALMKEFRGVSLPLPPVILAGQNNLIDNLMFRQSRPLASRVVGRGHTEAIRSNGMAVYL